MMVLEYHWGPPLVALKFMYILQRSCIAKDQTLSTGCTHYYSLDHCPMSINTDQNLAIDPKYISMLIIADHANQFDQH